MYIYMCVIYIYIHTEYIHTYIHTYRVGSIQKHLGDRLRQARAEAPHGTARGNPLPPEASADTFG